jgi:hypothetical protein
LLLLLLFLPRRRGCCLLVMRPLLVVDRGFGRSKIRATLQLHRPIPLDGTMLRRVRGCLGRGRQRGVQTLTLGGRQEPQEKFLHGWDV